MAAEVDRTKELCQELETMANPPPLLHPDGAEHYQEQIAVPRDPTWTCGLDGRGDVVHPQQHLDPAKPIPSIESGKAGLISGTSRRVFPTPRLPVRRHGRPSRY